MFWLEVRGNCFWEKTAPGCAGGAERSAADGTEAVPTVRVARSKPVTEETAPGKKDDFTVLLEVSVHLMFNMRCGNIFM